MTVSEADAIITAEVKAILARGEPISRLLDNYVVASIMMRHPAITNFLPRNTGTIFDKYVIKIDNDTTKELQTFIAKLPGLISISMDGATVNGKQKVRRMKLSVIIATCDLIQLTIFAAAFEDCLHSFQK